MTNESGFNPEDEWVINPSFPNIRIQVDYENRDWRGAEEDGRYLRKKDFTDNICQAIEDLVRRNPLPYHHFAPPREQKIDGENKGGVPWV